MKTIFFSGILIFIPCYLSIFAQVSNDSVYESKKNTISESSFFNNHKQTQEIVYTSEGVIYSFNSDKIVDFTNHDKIVFPEGITASLKEKREHKDIEAELRIRNGEYQLFFVKEGNLSELYSNEDAWLEHFLKIIIKSQLKQKSMGYHLQNKINGDDKSSITDTLNSPAKNASIDIFLNTLKNLNLESNRFQLLSNRIEKGILQKDQKKIIGFIFGNFNLEDNKVSLLNQLIDSPSYSRENNDYLMSFIDQLQLESNKVKLMNKLMN